MTVAILHFRRAQITVRNTDLYADQPMSQPVSSSSSPIISKTSTPSFLREVPLREPYLRPATGQHPHKEWGGAFDHRDTDGIRRTGRSGECFITVLG
ncbi:hypothetical protein NPIL_95171 [Nephila pilipes]|uniref:Uncharacterized protein n=1 Tax=Nephila pilipes TaxID=299642 RepID=A0A8X6P4D0_NEPPI|nr:hypothetical protein NPIL_95171 [Nephila pilipes]